MNSAAAHGVRIAYDDSGSPAPGPAFLCLPGWGVSDSETTSGDFGHPELLEDALAVIEASGAESVIPIGQAHGAWIAVELKRRLGARVPAIVAMSWLVLDPPPPFRGVLEALQDRSKWQGARDQLFSMWTNGASAEIAERVRGEMGAYGFEMWARGGRSIAAEYARQGNPLRALSALTPAPRFLHVFSQPKAPEFLVAQQSFARENSWFEVRRMDAVSHFPPLEVPDATAAEIERFAAAQ